MIEAVKLTKMIESPTLTIQELEHFRGLTVEIIILAETSSPEVSPPHQQRRPKKTAGGMLAQYANPSLWDQEQTAWERAVREKYAPR